MATKLQPPSPAYSFQRLARESDTPRPANSCNKPLDRSTLPPTRGRNLPACSENECAPESAIVWHCNRFVVFRRLAEPLVGRRRTFHAHPQKLVRSLLAAGPRGASGREGR